MLTCETAQFRLDIAKAIESSLQKRAIDTAPVCAEQADIQMNYALDASAKFDKAQKTRAKNTAAATGDSIFTDMFMDIFSTFWRIQKLFFKAEMIAPLGTMRAR